MIITDIEQQKHNEKRYSIFIDNNFVFGLDDIDILLYKLKIGDEISKERYDYILENVIFAKCRDKAIKFLSYSSRSEKELFIKLKQEDYTEEIIYRVIDLLKNYGYIDDYTYAKNFIQDKFKIKGWGIKKLTYELKLKGIPSSIISSAFEETDLNEIEKAKELLSQKMRRITELDFKTKQKLYNFLLRRGFSYDIINSCFNELKIDNEFD